MNNSAIRLKDFSYLEDLGIHAPGNQDANAERFAYDEGDAAEGYLLASIKAASDVSDNSPELAKRARDWSSYYHLSAGRANHLRALDLPQDIAVLELGAGCGAISRYLGENHRRVDCVEGSLRRASIARQRCRDLDNVAVYCADFRKVEFEPNYDLVLLNGVLEYAPVFFGKGGLGPDEATQALLRLAKSALKEDGILVVAIENKIGLKYWCGATEDHTGILFDGIHGYPTSGTARTYSKVELQRILGVSGFANSQFYSCFPDYKFASTLLAHGVGGSEDYHLHNWIPYPAENPGLSRDYLIHEGLATKTLSDAGLIQEFANSFLVVAAAESPPLFAASMKPAWLACKASTQNRDKSLHCLTKFYPAKSIVEKNRIDYSVINQDNARPLGHTPEAAAWVEGELLSWEVAKSMMSKDFHDSVPAILKEYHEELLNRYATGTTDGKGYPQVRGECFDFIMANIIRSPDGLKALDEEWKLERTLTADFMIYRSICYDVLGLNKQWLGMKVPSIDGFAVAMIRTLYPRYDADRHEENRTLENTLLLQIRGDLGETGWETPSGVAWKRAVKELAKKIPFSVKTKIIRFTALLHEKTLGVFEVS